MAMALSCSSTRAATSKPPTVRPGLGQQRLPSSTQRQMQRPHGATAVQCGAAPPKRVDVAICGGGLGGLALASALQSRGYDAHVFEAAPELRTAHGTCIGVATNASYSLEACVPACLPQIMEAGVERSSVSVATKATKEEELQRKDFPIPKLGEHQFFGVRWSEVQRVLSSFVAPDLVHCDHRVTGYTEQPEDGMVRLHFKGQPDVAARLAVAADGLRSALRETMVPTDPGPRYLGQMNYGALLFNPGGSVVPLKHGFLLRDVYQPAGATNWKLQALVMDAGGGYTYWTLGVESEEPLYLPDAQGVRPPKSYLGVRAGHPGSKAHAKELLVDVGFDHLLPFVEATPEAIIHERGIVDRVPLDELGANLYSEGGRVLLMGDAAHAMHPGPGLGAQMAFEDACVLVSLLDKHRGELAGWKGGDGKDEAQALQPGADAAGLAAVLSEYQEQRLERVCRVQRLSSEMCGLASLRSRVVPPGLSDEQARARQAEMYAWVAQFPNNPVGDPASQFWKPAAKVEAHTLNAA